MPPSALAASKTSVREALARKLLAAFPPKAKRILLVTPPDIPEANFDVKVARARRYPSYPPYGMAVLCRHVQARGYAADLIDLNYRVLADAHARGEDFRYSIWKDMLRRKLEEFRPDVVGVTCMFTMTHEPMLEAARLVKEFDPAIPVLVGGVHPSNATDLVLRSSEAIDFVQLYEAEESLPDLLDFVNGKAKDSVLRQLASRVEGETLVLDERVTPEADAMRLAADYHELPIGDYDRVGQLGNYVFLRDDRPATSILGVKGCRARCSFCSVRSFNGLGVRARDVDVVVDEMQALVERYGIKHFTWLDDDLFYDPKRTVALFNEIVRRKLDITWDATNGVIAAAIDEENAHAAAESGCVGMNLGIETGSPEILRAIHKPGTLDNFRDAKRILIKYPQIFLKGFLIIGFPKETVGQLLQTVRFAVELGLDWYSMQILQPLPSTEIYRTMIEAGLLEDNMKTGAVTYYGGLSGKERQREQREKDGAEAFLDLFGQRELSEPARKEELPDFWFLMDYKVNYEKLQALDHPVKLRQHHRYLLDVCDRMTAANPTGHAIALLYLAIVERKLGRLEESRRRLAAAGRSIESSVYWQNRFKTLDLFPLLRQEQALAAGGR